MNNKIEALLDTCVKKSLGWDPKKAAKFSIVPMGDFDPVQAAFENFEHELAMLTIGEKVRAERGIKPE